ncbi:MAG: hypothetical protein OXE17_02885, partial [Chloroflexi bacterium]|nr:hypothetical protein [Chloroflexota bacterium]
QWSERESKYKPQLFQVPGQRRDMDLLCLSHIQLLSSRGVPWSDMAILYRQARTINRLRTILLHRDVPYQILMDRSDSKEPCDSHCVMELLTLLLNPLDDRAFRLAAAPGYPNKERALREPASRQVRRISREQELDLVEAGSSYLAQLQEGHPDHASLSYLVHCMRILSESVRAPECTAEQLFQIAKDLVLEFQPPNKAGSEDAGLTALQNAWRETPQPAGKTIVRQLTDLMDSTYSAIRTPPSLSQNSLSVGTLQAAKGRQWPYVFVLDVSADTIPGRPGSGLETKEREQRLFYLAMSRATDCLVFYSPFADSKSEKRRLSSFFDPISHLLDIPAS